MRVGDLVDGALIDASFEQDGLSHGSRTDGGSTAKEKQKSLVSVVVQEISHFERIADRVEAENPPRRRLEEFRRQSETAEDEAELLLKRICIKGWIRYVIVYCIFF